MHPLIARQTPGDPVPSESPSEPGPGSTGEPSVSAAEPSSSETLPPASESTPPPPESSSEPPPPPPPPPSSSEESSVSPSSTLEQSSTTPAFTPPSETPTPSPTPFTQQLDTLTTPTSPSLTESTESTASLTTVTTTVNGLPTTYVTPVPTSRLASGGGDSRTGLIAGLTAGLIALLVVILSAVFLYRRHRLRRQMEVLTAEKKRKEGRSLLDGEGFEDDDHDLSELGSRRGFVAMRSYNNVNQQPRSTPLGSPSPYGTQQTQRSASPTLSILRSRASESGSIFREDVWPPPAEGLVDPITKESSQVDLSRVVDEVMGPSSAQPHSRQGTHTSVDSMSPLILNHDYDTTHSRGPSVDSQYMDPFQSTSFSSSSFARPQSASYPSLAGAAALASLSSSPSGGVASSSTSHPQLSQVVPPPPATMPTASTSFHRRPPSPIPFVTSPTSMTPFSGSYTPTPLDVVAVLPASSSSSQQRSTPPISIIPIPTKNPNRSSVPKKSSPLARRLSQDALTWLSRGGPPGAGSQSKHS